VTAAVQHPAPETQHRISISQFRFAPAELTVAVGDTVAWSNGDALPHTTTADSGAWSSPELAAGSRFIFVPKRAGRYTYHCAAHPVMRGLLTVRE
jgi:plastocyanin